eukprot:1837656-Pleurochrysis_carterae.AAC.1
MRRHVSGRARASERESEGEGEGESEREGERLDASWRGVNTACSSPIEAERRTVAQCRSAVRSGRG